MCSVSRALMRLQDAQKKEPETEGFPREGGQGERTGTEPTYTTQVLSRQVPALPFKCSSSVRPYQQASSSLRFMIFCCLGILSLEQLQVMPRMSVISKLQVGWLVFFCLFVYPE